MMRIIIYHIFKIIDKSILQIFHERAIRITNERITNDVSVHRAHEGSVEPPQPRLNSLVPGKVNGPMIVEHVAALNAKRIILASQSPRRRDILTQLGLTNFEQRPSGFAEDLDLALPPHKYAVETARHKAVDIWKQASQDRAGHLPDLVIAADTIIVAEGRILGKPKDADDAFAILSKLSGRTHQVITGVALCYKPSKQVPATCDSTAAAAAAGVLIQEREGFVCAEFANATRVTFASLSKTEISAYITTGEPMDKAGGYGIQGVGGAFVEKIDGDYYTVMGFPLQAFARTMKDHVLPHLLPGVM